MATEFKIGSSLETLTRLEELTVPLPAPKAPFREVADIVTVASGLVVGKGFPNCQWIFSLLTTAQRDQLKTFCPNISARVYMRTMTNDADAYKTYQAVMIWPVEEDRDPTARHDRLELIVEFRRMVEVAT